MKHWNVGLVPVLLGTLGVVVLAAEKPPENYQQAMKNLGAFAQGMPKAAQDGVKAAADLGVTANLKSKEGAEYSAKIITDTCMGCHMAHRERAADGTFQIK